MYPFASRFSLPNFCSNEARGGKFWVMWSNQIKFDMISMSNQAILSWIVRNEVHVLITFVYAKCAY